MTEKLIQKNYDDVDIDALREGFECGGSDKGKGKGQRRKGHLGKGKASGSMSKGRSKGDDEGKGKGKDGGNQGYVGLCCKCGVPGHKQWECHEVEDSSTEGDEEETQVHGVYPFGNITSQEPRWHWQGKQQESQHKHVIPVNICASTPWPPPFLARSCQPRHVFLSNSVSAARPPLDFSDVCVWTFSCPQCAERRLSPPRRPMSKWRVD